MAAFPGAVKSFTTKNPGDTIQASHVDDLQDEVAAIEDGYLNGTARLNSSLSTLASLSVTGGSTIAGGMVLGGALSVGGASTLTGNVHIGGNLQVDGNSTITGSFVLSGLQTNNSQPRVRVFAGSTQGIPSGSETALTFDSEDYDPQGLHSTSSQPTRINITSTGVWLIGATGNFAATTQSGYLRFRKNGATAVGSAQGWGGDGVNAHIMRVNAQAVEVFSSASDYVEVLCFQNAGVSLQLGNNSSRVDQNEFYAVKLW